MNDDQLATIVRALTNYLRANPLACDTITGIARWWVEPEARVSMAALEEALAWLTRFGALEEIVSADGRKRYRRLGDDTVFDAAARAASAPTTHTRH